VLLDLTRERGLTDPRVAEIVAIAESSEDAVDIVYGCVVPSRLDEDRVARKRKRKGRHGGGVDQISLAPSAFLVLPAAHARQAATLSVKRCVLQSPGTCSSAAFPRRTQRKRRIHHSFSSDQAAGARGMRARHRDCDRRTAAPARVPVPRGRGPHQVLLYDPSCRLLRPVAHVADRALHAHSFPATTRSRPSLHRVFRSLDVAHL
jgi:hypothetical protein